MLNANAAAAAYFEHVLWECPEGAIARQWLKERQITRAMAEEWGLGWAPRHPTQTQDVLVAKGWDEDLLVAAGVVVERQDEGGTIRRARFRDRLMLPFALRGGEVMGFEGHLIWSGEPQVLTSPESAFFSRSSILRRTFAHYHLQRSPETVVSRSEEVA